MEHIKSLIRTIPDFPKPGIQFRDITTLLMDAKGLRDVVEHFTSQYQSTPVDMVVGIESRGFIVGAPLAVALGKGFVPVRKPGKLPGEKIGVEYALEYGTDRLEIHTGALEAGMKVLLVDDLLATGGTMAAACHLVEQLGCEVAGLAFVVELPELKGRDRLKKYPIQKMVSFEGH